jgi:hypothetical protein
MSEEEKLAFLSDVLRFVTRMKFAGASGVELNDITALFTVWCGGYESMDAANESIEASFNRIRERAEKLCDELAIEYLRAV